jgi:hypothetical protein
VVRLPDPPVGSRFTLGEDAEGGPRLSWPSLGREHSSWGGVCFLTLWLCGWVLGEVFASLVLLGMTLDWGPMAGGAKGPPLLFLVGWLGAWTIGGFLAWRTWLTLVFGSRTESITFADGELIIRPGLTPEFVAGVGRGSLDGAAPRKPRVVGRGQVAAGLRLEPLGGRQRLSIDCGADRVEIGAGLNEEERVWLHQVLKEWGGGGKGEFFSLSWPVTPRRPGA